MAYVFMSNSDGESSEFSKLQNTWVIQAFAKHYRFFKEDIFLTYKYTIPIFDENNTFFIKTISENDYRKKNGAELISKDKVVHIIISTKDGYHEDIFDIDAQKLIASRFNYRETREIFFKTFILHTFPTKPKRRKIANGSIIKKL